MSGLIRCIIIMLALCVNFLFVFNGGFAEAFPEEISVRTTGYEVKSVSDELLVKFKCSEGDIDTLHKSAGASEIDEIDTLQLVRVKLAPGVSSSKALNEYSSSPLVEYVQPNYLYHALLAPDDPHYWRQWGMPAIAAEQAWKITMGTPEVVVAVLDTGIDLNHPDLAQNMVNGINIINPGLLPQDDHGHGTHVAGIVAAVTNNGVGVAGVAGNCSLMPVKVLDSDGGGTDFGVAQGIQWAADNGARVINLSLGGPEYSKALEDAVKYARAKGSLIVAAAGNEGSNKILYPAAFADAIAVGATDIDDELAYFSNYGNALDIVAPGVSIFSTVWDDSYDYMSGTSMSAPHVAGVAALVLSYNPDYTLEQVESAIINNTDDLGAPGWDPYYGHGRLNAWAALNDNPIMGSGIISGFVYLEGKSDLSGADVSVSGVGRIFKTTTGFDGSFAVNGLPAGTYELKAGMGGYLNHAVDGIEVVDEETVELGNSIILLAGDFSLDNIVDIDDLLMLRDAYGATDESVYWNPVMDVNMNGSIDLIDMVYLTRNYSKTGH